MSKSVRKRKNHWSNKVHESVLGSSEEGPLGLELRGGAEHGQFPVVGAAGGHLGPDELLLEVNDTPVAGLTSRDVHAVVRHSKEPVRLKCVKQGERALKSGLFCVAAVAFALISQAQLSPDGFSPPARFSPHVGTNFLRQGELVPLVRILASSAEL